MKPTPLAARTDADFVQEFIRYEDDARTQPLDLGGWTFRFAVKAAALDDDALLEATSLAGVSIEDEPGGRLKVTFDKSVLLAAMPEATERLVGVYALQAAGPAGVDEVWAAGPFTLLLGV